MNQSRRFPDFPCPSAEKKQMFRRLCMCSAVWAVRIRYHLPSIQVFLRRESILTHTPDEISDFVWSLHFPYSVPELSWGLIGGGCALSFHVFVLANVVVAAFNRVLPFPRASSDQLIFVHLLSNLYREDLSHYLFIKYPSQDWFLPCAFFLVYQFSD
ncbi:uncharacterized protein LOC130139302 isoform X1 [Syzygium oleosum]|uniref:uncharacterized protein LOC130139302 isoform X1 n=1 Tax=Syzygium oleosum TaxID=219896 RepID=UPI0024BB4F9D|nr:uncharacterized protein LOC130139302 isoform X1 [Syzygium oleosum]